MTSDVRIASRDDEDALYDLMMALWRDNPLGLPYRPEVVLSAIRMGTRPEPGKPLAVIGVIDGENELLGSVGLFLGPAAWFVDDIWWLFEKWLYVRATDPDRARHSDALFAFAAWARDKMRADIGPGYPFPIEVVMSWTGSDRHEAKDRLWSRYGKKVGSSFVLK